MNKYTVFTLGLEFGYTFALVDCVDMGEAYSKGMRWIALPPGWSNTAEIPGAQILKNGWILVVVSEDFLCAG